MIVWTRVKARRDGWLINVGTPRRRITSRRHAKKLVAVKLLHE